MRPTLKLVLAIAIAAAAILASAAALVFVVWAGFEPPQRDAFTDSLHSHVDLAIFASVLIVAIVGIGVSGLFRAYVLSARRLAEETRIIARTNPAHRLPAVGGTELAHIAREINALADHYRDLTQRVDERIAAARADLEQEKNRLAALMEELVQGVLVCNVEGRILLHNRRSRTLLRSAAHGSEVGLGRSVFGVIDRDALLHALEHVAVRLDHGEVRPVAKFTAALADGTLARVLLSPVLASEVDASEGSADTAVSGTVHISGYVLAFEEPHREVAYRALLDRLESPLSSLRSATENLAAESDAGPALQDAVRAVQTLTGIVAAARDASGRPVADPGNETMLGRDLLAAARRRIESRAGIRVTLCDSEEPAWITVDSYALVQALVQLAACVRHETGAEDLALSCAPRAEHVQIEFRWSGRPLTQDAVDAWRGAPDAATAATASFAEAIGHHHGRIECVPDAGGGEAAVRLLLPASPQQGSALSVVALPSRPAFYDFDLFRRTGLRTELDDCPLADLHFTVFDTETTGLNPAEGDEIISIGAIRIVNGRLLHGEVFDQLVDPRRPLPPGSTRIHGIEPAMLVGQPGIEQVLPRFSRFCADTVLVAHNAAFDMRFLQLKEAKTGIRFDQTVLDTLMLSAVAHPHQETHDLEAIAARLGVNVVGRHTALGDAIVTAEIFLKLLPLLAAAGISTLRQAREASQRTRYAKIRY